MLKMLGMDDSIFLNPDLFVGVDMGGSFTLPKTNFLPLKWAFPKEK